MGGHTADKLQARRAGLWEGLWGSVPGAQDSVAWAGLWAALPSPQVRGCRQRAQQAQRPSAVRRALGSRNSRGPACVYSAQRLAGGLVCYRDTLSFDFGTRRLCQPHGFRFFNTHTERPWYRASLNCVHLPAPPIPPGVTLKYQGWLFHTLHLSEHCPSRTSWTTSRKESCCLCSFWTTQQNLQMISYSLIPRLINLSQCASPCGQEISSRLPDSPAQGFTQPLPSFCCSSLRLVWNYCHRLDSPFLPPQPGFWGHLEADSVAGLQISTSSLSDVRTDRQQLSGQTDSQKKICVKSKPHLQVPDF